MHRNKILIGVFLVGMGIISACSFGSRVVPSTPLPGSSAPTLTQAPAIPASNELINAALSRGEISSQTAMVFKVFAQFSDPRLPSIYQGSANLSTDSHIIDELQAEFSSLPAETQAALIPFLIPPVYKGSWADPATDRSWSPAAPGGPATPGREGAQDTPFKKPLPCDELDTEAWDYKTGMHSPVRFWWRKDQPGDSAVVDRFLVAMDDEIWPRLTSLMGKIPVPDGEVPCNGGSPDFDVYVTPDVARSSAPSISPPGCRETPSYILLNPSVSDAILAHEFMHAIQWAFNTSAGCMYPGEYAWLAEATASWSQDYVYPDDNEEQTYVNWFYEPSIPTLALKNDAHEYGAYLFFFYLTHKFDQPGIVKNAWDNTASTTSLKAVDQAIPGGFDAVWGEFAVKNMIEPPYDDYQLWDQLNVKPVSKSLSKGDAAPNKTYDLPLSVDPLVIYYDWFTFTGDSRLVTFFNGLAYKLDDEPIDAYMGILPIKDGTRQYKFSERPPEDIEGLKIQAYFKVQGDTDWQLEDWTDKPYMSFCRDASAERLTDLVIVVSNSSQELTIGQAGNYGSLVQVSDIGCYRYGGDASMIMTGQGEGGSFSDDQELPNVAFERTETHPNIPYPFLHFKVAEGQLDRTYSYTSTDGTCTGSGETHDALTNSSSPGFGNDLYILYGAVSGASVRRYGGSANSNQTLVADFQCPDGRGPANVLSMPWFYTDVLSQINKVVYTVPEDGQLQGSGDLLQELTNAGMLYTWNLQPLFESAGSSGTGAPPDQPVPPGGSNPPAATSQAPGTSPGASLPGVPGYPNSESAQQTSAWSLFITTSDSREQVIAFYRGAFVDQGWSDGSSPATPEPNKPTMLVFMKDNAVVTIQVSSSGEKTMIMINKVTQ